VTGFWLVLVSLIFRVPCIGLPRRDVGSAWANEVSALVGIAPQFGARAATHALLKLPDRCLAGAPQRREIDCAGPMGAALRSGLAAPWPIGHHARTICSDDVGSARRVISDETGTGVVFSNSPALVTPNLGTPSAAILMDATGLPVASGVSGLASGAAALLATPSSANLRTLLTDE
jgi:hypothetical protein